MLKIFAYFSKEFSQGIHKKFQLDSHNKLANFHCTFFKGSDKPFEPALNKKMFSH